jgi:hypothetical protein
MRSKQIFRNPVNPIWKDMKSLRHILSKGTEFTLRNLGVALRQGHMFIKGTDFTLGNFVHLERLEQWEA